jgi:hypothetical protein
MNLAGGSTSLCDIQKSLLEDSQAHYFDGESIKRLSIRMQNHQSARINKMNTAKRIKTSAGDGTGQSLEGRYQSHQARAIRSSEKPASLIRIGRADRAHTKDRAYKQTQLLKSTCLQVILTFLKESG